MLVLGLITCIVLRALSAQAKVVTNFNECRSFFYKNMEPRGMDQNAKKICQKLENGSFHYASLYSVLHKIPLYSAYTLNPGCSSDAERTDIWHLEPQISQSRAKIFHMVRENQNNSNDYKENQAISSDYSDSTYDRGHLNPSSFQCGDGRTATFTLTNAAPLDPCFKRIHWNKWESTLRLFLKNKLDKEERDSATAFIVTGTVPNANVRIPHKGTSEEPERVTVPSHVWTAVCYKHHMHDSESFSFGYMGRNQPESKINLMSVSDLNDQLSILYSGTQQLIKIFFDDCFGYKNKLNEIMEELEKVFNLPVNQADQMSSELQNTYLALKWTLSSDSVSEKKVKDKLKGYRCYSDQTLIECSPPYSRITVNGEKCLDNHPCATYGTDYYWCKTGPAGYFKRGWDYCSPPLRSSKATNGKYCRSNHACAKYGKSTPWCYTDEKGNYDDCCTSDDCRSTVNGQTCRDNHPCGYHGKSYLWCYTDDGDNWDYCCTVNCSK